VLIYILIAGKRKASNAKISRSVDCDWYYGY